MNTTDRSIALLHVHIHTVLQSHTHTPLALPSTPAPRTVPCPKEEERCGRLGIVLPFLVYTFHFTIPKQLSNMTRICYQQPTLASTHARRRVLEQRRMALIQQASAPRRNDAARHLHQRRRIRQYDDLWKKVTTMATRIVAYARGFLCRKYNRERCAAVTRIATTFRGFRARKRLTEQRRAATHITAFVRGCQHRHRCAKQHRAANKIQSVALEFLSRKKETLLEQVTPHLLQRLMCDNVFEDELLGRFSDTSDDHDASLGEITAAVSPRGSKRKALSPAPSSPPHKGRQYLVLVGHCWLRGIIVRINRADKTIRFRIACRHPMDWDIDRFYAFSMQTDIFKWQDEVPDIVIQDGQLVPRSAPLPLRRTSRVAYIDENPKLDRAIQERERDYFPSRETYNMWVRNSRQRGL